MTFPMPFMPPGQQTGDAATVSYRTSSASGTNATSYSFVGLDIGTAASNRQVVVGIKSWTGIGTSSVSSVTIAGVSATQIVQANNSSHICAIFAANVTSGTTGTIDVTFGASQDRCVVMVWDVKTFTTASSATGTSTSNPGAININVPAGGVCIGVCGNNTNNLVTWTNLTENVDSFIENSQYSGASSAFASAQAPLAVSVSFTTPSNQTTVSASWGTQ